MERLTEFQEQVVRWSEDRSDIQAVLLIGSLARTDHPADEWSDVDMILFADDIEVYADSDLWLTAFGGVLVPAFERHEAGDIEWLVLFADGLKADFYFTPGAADLDLAIAEATYHFVIRRGAKVLYVRPGTAVELPPFKAKPVAPPDAVVFQVCINEMLLNAHKMAKFTRRGELVRAKLVLESLMRPALLTMIAWHARAQFGPERDTWYDGRYLSEWADPRVLLALPNTYGGYSVKETWRSLFGMMILFRWVAEETAVLWHYEFPIAAADQVMEWVGEMYIRDSESHLAGAE